MRLWHSSPRQAETTLPCDSCGHTLLITRTCHEVSLRCPACGATFPLSSYIRRADEAMEAFLEEVYMDRI